jgi:pantoate kinase
MGCSRKRTAIAEVPSHITGFFSVVEDKDPSKKGSVGCGFTLDFSVRLEVEEGDRNELLFLGKRIEMPTFETLLRLMGVKGIRARILESPPLGVGLGVSGAIVLGSSLSISLLKNLNFSYIEASEFAHIAEVLNQTGLGDVIAQSTGGVVLRRKAGALGKGIADRILTPELPVTLLFLGEKSTKGVLEDEDAVRRIKEVGAKCFREFLRDKSLNSFIQLSKLFAKETELVNRELIEIVEEVERRGGKAGIAMLGETIFQINGDDLREYGEVVKTRITTTPGRLIYDS